MPAQLEKMDRQFPDMLTVYAIPLSLYCAKLRILLRYKGLDWQEIPPPGGYGSAAYKEVVPSGNLPALRDGDLLLADSEAIAEYLNEKHPQPPLLPGNLSARAQARERSRFHDTRLEPEVRQLFSQIECDSRDTQLAARQSDRINARLAQLAQMLDSQEGTRDGFQLTLGDCGFPITFAWMDGLTKLLNLQLSWPDAVMDYRRELENHAIVAAELASYLPLLTAYIGSGEAE